MADSWSNDFGSVLTADADDLAAEEAVTEHAEVSEPEGEEFPVTDSAPAARKSRVRAGKRRTASSNASGYTRAQVQQVLDLRAALDTASKGATEVLTATYRAEGTLDDLAGAILTQPKLDPDPLRDLFSLRDATGSNPLMAPAIIAGMDRASRGRVHAVLVAATGDDSELPRDDVQATVHIAQMLATLSDDDSLTLDEAMELRG